MAATKLRIYQDALRLLADQRLSLITDDVESRYALDDSWDEAVAFVLRQAPWRFALATTGLSAAGAVAPGYTNPFGYPVGWLRTHALFTVSADGREYPVDLRDTGNTISANVPGLLMRFVSSVYADPGFAPWPEHFAQALAAYLAFLVAERVTGERGAAGRVSQVFNQLLGEAVRLDAEPENRWLPHQRSGGMLRGALVLLREGYWRFALATVAPAASGTPVAGYSVGYRIPDDWVRTHALFVPVSGMEAPVDVREAAGIWSTNSAAMRARYVSRTRGTDPALWPESFMAALLVMLEGEPPPAQNGQPRAASAFQEALAAALATDSDPPDRWLRHQFSGEMLRGALDLLTHGFWRFAMADATISAQSGVPVPQFAHSFAQPADLLRSHKLFLIGASPECPLEIRERGGYWSTNVSLFYARYVSRTLGTDSTRWPDSFRLALLEYLDAERPAAPQDQQQIPRWLQALTAALAACADPPDPWLRHELSGAYGDGMRFVMQQGYWVFRDGAGVMRGLKEVQLSSLDDQSAATPSYGFPYRYPLPADWFKTHALFVPWDGQECPINIRETAHEWSTDADSFVARYLATDVLDSTLWPEPISTAVLAYLDWQAAPAAEAKMRAEAYAATLAIALKDHSRPQDDLLRFQLDGRFEQEKRKMIETGRWRFAVKTVVLTESSDPLPSEESDGTVSDSYVNRFIQPNDLMRTLRVYYERGVPPYNERFDIDYRDEQAAYHANFTPISVRYVSRMALDSTKWSAAFRIALRAYLLHIETPANPMLKKNYDDAIMEAERLDDARDRPAIKRSRFASGRFGRRSDFDRMQGFSSW